MLRRQFDTNVFGVVDVTNAILPHMRLQKKGTIVNVGSRSVWRDIPVSESLYYNLCLKSVQGLGKMISLRIFEM